MQVTFQEFAAFTIFCLAGVCITISNRLSDAMIGEINRQVPEKDRISYFFGYPAKTLKIHREYRRLYPQGRLSFRCKLFGLVGISLGFLSWGVLVGLITLP